MARRCRRRRGCGHLKTSIAVRRGGAADRGFILDLGRRTVSDSVSSLRNPAPGLVVGSYERLIDFALDQSHESFIATSAGEPLGFLLMLDALPDEVTGLEQAFVVYMAVEPHARRMGIAAHLLAAAEDAARARGLEYLALMVTEENAAARELYAQAGYFTERRLLCKPL